MAYAPLQVDQEGRILEDVPCSGCNRSLKGQVAGALCPDCGETIALSMLGRAVCRLDRSGHLDESVACTTCGNVLRGVDPNGNCPNCQMPVGPSLEANLLRYSDRRWTKKVADGLVLYVIALGLTICLGIGAGLLRLFIKDPAVVTLVSLAATAVSGLFMVLALWWMTAPDPDTPIAAQKRWGADLARYLVVPQFLAGASLGAFSAFTSSKQGQALVILLQAPVMILGLVVGVGVLLHMRELARRVVDEKLANWARIILWLSVVGTIVAMLGVGAIAGTALATGLPVPGSGGQPPAGSMLVAGVAGGIGSCVGGLVSIIATIWMIVLIFQLRRYFASAARAAGQEATR